MACDYLFIHKSIHLEFLAKLYDKIDEFFGKDPQKSKDYIRIVSESQTKRLESYLKE